MNDVDLEQRLRTTFHVVAERDVVPWPAPQRAGSGRRLRARPVLAGASALVVVAGAVAFAVAYGPRSGPAIRPASPPSATRSTYIVPASPLAPSERQAVAATLLDRLKALGAEDPAVIPGRFPATHGGEGFQISAGGVSQLDLQAVASTGAFYIRPVLCGAPSYSPPKSPFDVPASPFTVPTCGSQYETSEANLAVTPDSSPQGYSANDVPADPSFASYPDTPVAADEPNTIVLLPAQGSAYPRVVLDPAQMNGSSVARATATFSTLENSWVVDVQLTSAGAAHWDEIALENFHQFVALDLDGQVISAPLIQPTSDAFTSFGGKLEISGDFTADQARTLAAVVGSGPLPVQVTPPPATSTTTTTSPGTTTPTPATGSPTVTINGWTGRRPEAIYFSGDAGDVATGLTWSRWDGTEAVGHGTRNELGCVPDCAQGTATPYPVTITLSDPVGGKFTTIVEQTADGRGTTETFAAPDLGQGACTTSDQASCVF